MVHAEGFGEESLGSAKKHTYDDRGCTYLKRETLSAISLTSHTFNAWKTSVIWNCQQ